MNLFGDADTAPMAYQAKGARISDDEGKIYRYQLWRRWEPLPPEGKLKSCLFIMLNPSTADGTEDDPTIRRCVDFARRWGFGVMEVVNLFAYRATDPRVVLGLHRFNIDPVGYQNKRWVQEAAAGAGLIVCAWGTHGAFQGQDRTMKGWLQGHDLWALKLTKSGQPCHPLYMPADTKLLRYN